MSHFKRTEVINPFRIIENNPVPTYFENLEWFYTTIKKEKYSKKLNVDNEESKNKYLSFLSAVAAYKNEQSIKIFTDVLNKKVSTPTNPTNQELEVEIYKTLKNNTADIYNNLVNSLEPKALEYIKKNTFILPTAVDLPASKFW